MKKKITMEILMMRTNLSQKIDQLIASLKTYKIYNWLGWIQAWMQINADLLINMTQLLNPYSDGVRLGIATQLVST